MRVIQFSALILLSAFSSFGQGLSDGLLINGLRYRAQKKEIIEALGQPDKTYDPQYECGFFSSYEQGKPFEDLKYGNLIITGTNGEPYLFKEIPLDSDFKVTYNGKRITSSMNFYELLEIFGLEVLGSFHESYTGEELVRNEHSDDGLIFHLQDGKLMKIEYWSPC